MLDVSFEKVLLHAERELQRQSGNSLEAHLDLFRKFLKVEDQRLAMQHRFALEGLKICKQRSWLLDILIQRIYAMGQQEYEEKSPGDGSRCAIVAVGGYGRGELNFHSDIDLMFLFPDKVDGFGKFILTKVLYLLWDLGMTIGHSARTIADAMQICATDMVTRTALFESRLIAGDGAILNHLHEKLADRFTRVSRNVQSYLTQKLQEREERHRKFGSSLYLQEPNVKEGIGGIRDLHTVFWILRLKYGALDLGKAATHHLLTHKEVDALWKAYDFLLAVRNELHLCSGKKMDILTRAYQPRIALAFGYKDQREQTAAEIFMKRYYLHGRTVAFHTGNLLAKLSAHDSIAQPSLKFLKHKELDHGLVLQGDTLFMSGNSAARLQKNPLLLLHIFMAAQSCGAKIREDLRAIMRNHLFLVEKRFQTSEEAAKLFRQILSRRGMVAPILRAMHDIGFLGKYIPEFGKITCHVQDSEYHRYTTDEHTLKAIEFIDDLYDPSSTSHQTLRNLARDCEQAEILYLAMLLHDLGKLNPDDHVSLGLILGQKAMKRLRLSAEEMEKALFLIREHLSLSHIAQRRDLDDVTTIIDFSVLVKTQDNLRNLAVLTYADANAVGPGIWTPWKEALVIELTIKTEDWLAGRAPQLQHKGEIIQKTADAVRKFGGAGLSSDRIREHLDSMPLPYCLRTPVSVIAKHIELLSSLKDHPFLMDWSPAGSTAAMMEASVCAVDRMGLFAILAGCFTLSNINIVGAQINTTSSGVVLDSFRVSNVTPTLPIDKRMIDEFAASLEWALKDPSYLESKWSGHECGKRGNQASHHKIPPVVLLDNRISGSKTVVEIQALDRPGLLFHISRILSSLQLNICAAKISTERALAYDVFYVTDAKSEKILSAHEQSHIIASLLDGLKSA